MPVVLAATALTALVAFLLPGAVRRVLARLQVLDVPVERSSHTVPTLRGGGLAPAVAIALGLALLAGGLSAVDPRSSLVVVVIATTGILLALLGFVEDVHGVPTPTRALLQVVIGVAASSVLVVVTGSPAWLAPVGAVAVAGYVNVANFLDGINAISGLHGLVAGSVLAFVGFVDGRQWLVGTGAAIAVAFVAFLPWNLGGRGLFLGDVGSYLLGGSLAVTAVAAVAEGLPVLAVAGPLVPYLADAGTTLGRRILRGDRWFEAHRTHVYQVLAARWGHGPVAGVVAGFSIASGLVGCLTLDGLASPLVVVAALAALSSVYLALPRLLQPRAVRGGVHV